MKLDFCIYTDGDLTLDKKYFDRLLSKWSYEFKNYTYHSGYEDEFYFKVEFEIPNEYAKDDLFMIRDFTEAFVKSIRFNHMFLMKDLYELNEKVRHWLFFKQDEKVFTHYWFGNYDGTEFTIVR